MTTTSDEAEIISFKAGISKSYDPTSQAKNDLDASVTEQLLTRCQTRLDRAPYAELRMLQCSESNGEIILQGYVSSFHNKQLAQEAIRLVDGVHQIFNHVEVRPDLFHMTFAPHPR